MAEKNNGNMLSGGSEANKLESERQDYVQRVTGKSNKEKIHEVAENLSKTIGFPRRER